MAKKNILKKTNSLQGFCLLAMPHIRADYFSRSVVLICAHDNQGAMGFMLTKKVIQPTILDIYQDLNLTKELKQYKKINADNQVYCGGPIERGRGFVIHTADTHLHGTVPITQHIGFTSTVEALKFLAGDTPPLRSLVMLGYAAWSKGQIEQEITNNDWLIFPVNNDLVFNTPCDKKYEKALSLMGIEESALSYQVGTA